MFFIPQRASGVQVKLTVFEKGLIEVIEQYDQIFVKRFVQKFVLRFFCIFNVIDTLHLSISKKQHTRLH